MNGSPSTKVGALFGASVSTGKLLYLCVVTENVFIFFVVIHNDSVSLEKMSLIPYFS